MRPDSGNNVHFGDVFDREHRRVIPAEEQVIRANSASARIGESPKIPGNQYNNDAPGEAKNHQRPGNLSFLFRSLPPPDPTQKMWKKSRK